MKRVAFKMQLVPGCREEYERRHRNLWPELRRELKMAGISDYSIFLDEETMTLFAVQKLAAGHAVDTLAAKEIMQKWWLYMADIMVTYPDNSPVCGHLEEVFYLR